MAGSRIKGITIEIGGNATPLQRELSKVDKSLKQTENNLKDVNKLLKLDPGNTELLTQKQKNLERAIGDTKTRLQQLRDAQGQLKEGTEEWDALQREIIETEQKLEGLEKDYKQFGSVASQQMKVVGQKVKEVGDKISGVGEKLAPVSAAAGALGAGMLKLGYDAVTSADELTTLSKQTGMSTDELQKMQYAAELVDVSVEDITGALKKMKPKMTENNATFQKLGVSVKNADGSLRDATDVFYDSIEALSKIENETERDQVAMSLFGKSADSLAGIVDDGGAALKEFGKQAEDMGLILSGDTIAALNETNDTIDKVKGQLAGTAAQIGADVGTVLAPTLEKVAGYIGDLTQKLRDLSPEQQETILKVAGIVAALAPAIIIIGKLVSGIGSIISVLGTVVGVLGGPVTLAIGAVIAIGVLLWKNWDTVKERAKQLKDFLVKMWEAIRSGIAEKANNIKTAVSNAWSKTKETVVNTTENMRSMLAGKLDAIKQKYQEHGGGIQGLAAAAVEGVKQYWTLGFDTINTLLGGKLDTLKQKFTSAFDTVKSTVSNAINTIKGYFNFTWSLPKIKLPHFSISGQFSLNPPSIPKFSVDWYKRAMTNPVLFTSPTVLPTANGYKGFGDAGAEVVLGLRHLKQLAGADERIVPLLGQMLVTLDRIDDNSNRPIYLNGRELARALKDMGVSFV